nr:diphosphomevalonate decarboxylase [Candidatus Shapirobacteria bacterium]
MKKATAKAPSNIAFIKYWGRKDEKLRLPANDSLSMNLSNVFTITTVEFSPLLKNDRVEMVGGINEEGEERIIAHLDRVRRRAGTTLSARVRTKNNFPPGTGIASSASGFAALTLAATTAAGLKLSRRELSILTRQGSGSACRSIPDGFVEWKAGSSSQTSYAYSLFPPSWWQMSDIIATCGETSKKITYSEGPVFVEGS